METTGGFVRGWKRGDGWLKGIGLVLEEAATRKEMQGLEQKRED
jgi:hypothetical protein